MKAPAPKSNYEPIPAGTYIARCYSVIGLGTHDEEYQGTVKPKAKVRVTWELPTETREFEKDGEKKTAPLVIGKEYTLSMGDKANLRKHVEAMIGTLLDDEEANAFELFDLVGMTCLLSVAQKKSTAGNIYSVVASLAPLMKGQECPPAVNTPVMYDISHGKNQVYESLPNFIKEKIDDSQEMTGQTEKVYADEDINPDAIPF